MNNEFLKIKKIIYIYAIFCKILHGDITNLAERIVGNLQLKVQNHVNAHLTSTLALSLRSPTACMNTKAFLSETQNQTLPHFL